MGPGESSGLTTRPPMGRTRAIEITYRYAHF
jgi:hypothetical protein